MYYAKVADFLNWLVLCIFLAPLSARALDEIPAYKVTVDAAEALWRAQ